MTARILVAGIGNIFLGDDGFGSEVVRHAAIPPDDSIVRVIEVVTPLSSRKISLSSGVAWIFSRNSARCF